MLLAHSAQAAQSLGAASAATPWWVWPLALFVACFLMGIVAVPAGIGGGTLFVPIVGSFFPFHLDFVRGAGLLVALASAMAAGPMLLRSGLGSLRLALPLAVLASVSFDRWRDCWDWRCRPTWCRCCWVAWCWPSSC